MPWKRRAALNQPANAFVGLGYNIRMESAGCASVADADSPLDFDDNVAEIRGSLELCQGCLADMVSPDPARL